MPSVVRQVNFSPTPLYSRLPRDDELYVMTTFASHAKRCGQCARPYDVFLEHGTLCEKGLGLAKDVAQYVYNRDGKAYSLVDSQGNRSMQIEIPHGCQVIRQLLKAIEHGMQLYQRAVKLAPIISYDENYYIAPRPVREITQQPQYVTIEPSKKHRREKVYIPGRGSLYHSDMAERKQRREEEIIYYEAKPSRGARSSRAHHR
jgi:hypothetical protein